MYSNDSEAEEKFYFVQVEEGKKRYSTEKNSQLSVRSKKVH